MKDPTYCTVHWHIGEDVGWWCSVSFSNAGVHLNFSVPRDGWFLAMKKIMHERFSIFPYFFPFHAGLSPFWKFKVHWESISIHRLRSVAPLGRHSAKRKVWQGWLFLEDSWNTGNGRRSATFGALIETPEVRSSRLVQIRFVPVCMKWDRYIPLSLQK